ncbi:hypothetical protein Sinac_2300 [Singulisphaera acidiphila DSM 18658]|uniref:Uncharacterized protein n=1 Tax=Singulisphaera acidiphila (strain ATCC BAA-1392 / DSM 18658 / VKM B-2454 / MOB10) TaxID=886293 RepID=L0DCQ2_SINAD|nr:hypothetical protein Sinac_2300 [Singulisphaera acidiphila DSM 18658]
MRTIITAIVGILCLSYGALAYAGVSCGYSCSLTVQPSCTSNTCISYEAPCIRTFPNPPPCQPTCMANDTDFTYQVCAQSSANKQCTWETQYICGYVYFF